MQFQPKTENEIAEANLWPKGDYAFEVLFAKDSVSKKGSSMIEMQVGVYNADGKMRKLTDYLVASMEAKLRHFADAAGLLPQYQSGSLCAQDCVGRGGTCRLDIDAKDPAYAPKNVIRDYVVRKAKPLEGKTHVTNAAPATSPAEDDVPF